MPADDSAAFGDAIANIAADAQFHAFTDALANGEPAALAIVELVNAACHCDACHAAADRDAIHSAFAQSNGDTDY